MNACMCDVFHCVCIYLYVCVCVHCIQTNVCVPLYSAKGIDDVMLKKKLKFVCLFEIFVAFAIFSVGCVGVVMCKQMGLVLSCMHHGTNKDSNNGQ